MDDLSQKTVAELTALAAELGVDVPSKARKADLVAALEAAGASGEVEVSADTSQTPEAETPEADAPEAETPEARYLLAPDQAAPYPVIVGRSHRVLQPGARYALPSDDPAVSHLLQQGVLVEA